MSNNNIKALVLYWSHMGNTKDIAEAIFGALKKDSSIEAEIKEITGDLAVDYDDYHLIFCGSPVYSFLPPPEVTEFLKSQHKQSPILAAAPEKAGHAAVVFCTYAGGHTGEREAVPTLKYMAQFFEHKGIRVVDEWAVVGDFPDAQDPHYRRGGRLGDITGRPDESDLKNVQGRVIGLLSQLKNVLAE